MTKLQAKEDGTAASVTRAVRCRAPHGVRDDIAVTVYSNGTIGLREYGRALRTEQRLEIGELYAGAIEAAVRKSIKLAKEYAKSMSRAEARKRARREVGL